MNNLKFKNNLLSCKIIDKYVLFYTPKYFLQLYKKTLAIKINMY